MNTRPALLFAVIISLLTGVIFPAHVRADGPVLPCRSADALKEAVRYALENRDAALFWKLHAWTNVNAKSESMHKDLSRNLISPSAGENRKYSSFAFQPAPPAMKAPRTLKDGSQLGYNLPLEGLITFTYTGKNPNDGTSDYRSAEMLAYGRDASGNYLLAVQAVFPKKAATDPAPRAK